MDTSRKKYDFVYNFTAAGKNITEVINVKNKVRQLFRDKLVLVMTVLGLLTIVAAAGTVKIRKDNAQDGRNPYLDVPQTEGILEIGSGLVVSWVPQSADFLGGTVGEFAAERGIEESLLKTLLRKLDFSREQFELDMRDYSAGQKKKVLLAGSLCSQAHLYIWDEPLNYIDVFSRMQLEELILRYSPTLLLVQTGKIG